MQKISAVSWFAMALILTAVACGGNERPSGPATNTDGSGTGYNPWRR